MRSVDRADRAGRRASSRPGSRPTTPPSTSSRTSSSTRSLVSLYDFENDEQLFPDVGHRAMQVLPAHAHRAGAPVDAGASSSSSPTSTEHLDDPSAASPSAPTTSRCSTRTPAPARSSASRRDAELTKAIYRRVPVLVREGDPDGNPWGVKFLRDVRHVERLAPVPHPRAARGGRLRARRQRLRPRRRALAAAVRSEDGPPLRPSLRRLRMRPTAARTRELPGRADES